MGKCKSELYLLLTLCISELDVNNSLFLTTKKNENINKEIVKERVPNF
jgi:hypothetical protein